MTLRIDQRDSNRVARLKLLYLVPIALIAIPLFFVPREIVKQLALTAECITDGWNNEPNW